MTADIFHREHGQLARDVACQMASIKTEVLGCLDIISIWSEVVLLNAGTVFSTWVTLLNASDPSQHA